jgi:hypothetical protein
MGVVISSGCGTGQYQFLASLTKHQEVLFMIFIQEVPCLNLTLTFTVVPDCVWACVVFVSACRQKKVKSGKYDGDQTLPRHM